MKRFIYFGAMLCALTSCSNENSSKKAPVETSDLQRIKPYSPPDTTWIENKPRPGEIQDGTISTTVYHRGSHELRDPQVAFEKNFENITYRTKRHGLFSRDENNRPEQSYVPIFVMKSEYDSAQAERNKRNK